MREQMRAGRRHVCGGRMLPKEITHLIERDGAVFIFERVPASVCGDCGETGFRGPALDAIDRLIDERPTSARVVEAAVYELDAMTARAQQEAIEGLGRARCCQSSAGTRPRRRRL